MSNSLKIALAVVTIERPQAVQRLVRSVQRSHPDIHIYVGDQGREQPHMQAFFDQNGITHVQLPYDCGVSEARNRVVEHITEKYFLLCDDDFIFTDKTRIADAVMVLEQASDVGVVGGSLDDAFSGGCKVELRARRYEMYMAIDPVHRTLFAYPIHYFEPRLVTIAGVDCFECEVVLNFALFRREIFFPTVHWDANFKSDGEHEDFYLNLKINSGWRVLYLPSMTAQHERPVAAGYERKRARTGGWSKMLRKWRVEQYREYDAGLRTLAEVDRFQDEFGFTKARFLSSRTMCFDGKSHQGAGIFEVQSGGVRSLSSQPVLARPTVYGETHWGTFEIGGKRMLRCGTQVAAPVLLRPEAWPPPILAVTRDNPAAVQNLVRSVRQNLPEARILIADLSRRDLFMDEFYRIQGVELVRLSPESSVAVARRQLVEKVDAAHFVLCRDDHLVTRDTDFTAARMLLDKFQDVLVVGGSTHAAELTTQSTGIEDHAGYLLSNEQQKLLSFLPIFHLAPRAHTLNTESFFDCDAVRAFGVYRSDMMHKELMWDTRFGGAALDEDFFLHLKRIGGHKVAFLPGMRLDRRSPHGADKSGPNDAADWLKFFEKWSIISFCDFGYGLRSIPSSGGLVPFAELHRERLVTPHAWSPVPGQMASGDPFDPDAGTRIPTSPSGMS